MNIRPAKDTDLSAINRLLSQVLEVHHRGRPDIFKTGTKKYTDGEILAILKNEETPVFVAEDAEGKVCGYAFCVFQTPQSHVLTPIKTLYIDDLCVDESTRGTGVGRALYEHVLSFAKKADCYNVTLNVWACNEGALRFYERLGLRPQKIGMETILDKN